MSEAAPTPWERFWFRPVGPVGLRIVRLVVFGLTAMVTYTDMSVLKPSLVNAGAVWDPISFYRLIPAPPSWFLDVAYPVVVVFCGLAAFGIAGRFTTVPAGVLGAYLIGVGNNLGKINHDRNVLVMALFVLAAAPTPEARSAPSWRFRWPVAAVALGYALMLFFAGVSKLRTSGLEWVLSENMRNVLVSENLLLRDPAMSEVALWVAAEPWRWKLAAAMAVLGELGLVVGVLLRRPVISALFIAQGVGIIFGLNLFLDLGGWPLVVMTAVLVDWNELVARLRRPGALAVAAGVFTAIAAVTVAIRPPSLVVRETLLVVAMGAVAASFLSRLTGIYGASRDKNGVDASRAFAWRGPAPPG